MWLEGSNPSFSAINNGLWCNESTVDFGSARLSLNLGSPTITGDLRCGNRYLRGVRLVNSSYGNKPKEFESLSLTILIGTKQLSVTLLNSVITLKLIIWVKKKKNVR